MPATIEKLTSEELEVRVKGLGAQIRQRRKVMGISATTASEAAGVSRVTWHRMEKGEIKVTIGAWFNALAVLGLEFGIGLTGKATPAQFESDLYAAVPVSVVLADFPQLAALAWQVQGVDAVSPREAYDIYERNKRHIDRANLSLEEEALISSLETVLGDAKGV
jgi:transcriptional regulator with XRE-family HTH domain